MKLEREPTSERVMARNPRQYVRRAGALIPNTILEYKRVIQAVTKKTVRFWVTSVYSPLLHPFGSFSPRSKNLKTKLTSRTTWGITLLIFSWWLNRFPNPIFLSAKMLEIRHMSSLLSRRVPIFAKISIGLMRVLVSFQKSACFVYTWNFTFSLKLKCFLIIKPVPKDVENQGKYCRWQCFKKSDLKGQRKTAMSHALDS